MEKTIICPFPPSSAMLLFLVTYVELDFGFISAKVVSLQQQSE